MHYQPDFDAERTPGSGRWRLLMDGSIVDQQAEWAAPPLRLMIDGALSGAPHTPTTFGQIDDRNDDTIATERYLEPDHNARPKLALSREFAGR